MTYWRAYGLVEADKASKKSGARGTGGLVTFCFLRQIGRVTAQCAVQGLQTSSTINQQSTKELA
jgi:hypothetical protein